MLVLLENHLPIASSQDREKLESLIKERINDLLTFYAREGFSVLRVGDDYISYYDRFDYRKTTFTIEECPLLED